MTSIKHNNSNNNKNDGLIPLDEEIEIELSSSSSTSYPSTASSGNRTCQGISKPEATLHSSTCRRSTLQRSTGIRNMTSLIDEIVQESKESGIIGKEYTSFKDSSFYLHWLLTFGPIGIGVVLYWRGLWLLLDTYLYPGDENFVYSAWSSFILGIISGIVCHVISCTIQKLPNAIGSDGRGNNRRRKLITKSSILYSILERLYSFLVGFGVVNYWRGVWYLWDAYILTSYPIVQSWVSLLVGCLILFGLRAFRSVFAPPMVFLPDDANDVDGLTLELCDNNWYNDATAITENRRAFLKESHFVSVANLIDSKMKDSPKDTVEKKNIYSTAAPGGLRSTTGHTSVVNRSATDDNNIGDPTSRLSCTSSSSESVAVANGGDVQPQTRRRQQQ